MIASEEERDARRALLGGLVDYAGLFPPAAESMRVAAGNYAEYLRGPHAWALGKFVVPVARLAEFEDAARPLIDDRAPWSLSLIAGAGFTADVRAIEAFARRAGSVARAGAIEVRGASVEEIASIARNAALLRAAIPDAFDVYVEVPVASDPSVLIEAVASHGLRAKVRTGGTAADAFPAAAELARFFAACARYDVTFKATAGLHHAMRGSYPLTYDRASAQGTMFGFLNVFLAALFARNGLGAAETTALLEERDANAFMFTPAGVNWRGRTLSADAVRRARASTAASFGSCSFAEPVADLSSFGLL